MQGRSKNNLTTQLHKAASSRSLGDLLAILAEDGVDINGVTDNGETALYLAASKGYLDIVCALLEKGVDKEFPRFGGGTPFFIAVKQGHLPVVKALHQHGADIHTPVWSGETPLYMAISLRHTAIMNFLLEAGAKLRIINSNDGRSLLHAALANGSLDVIAMLLKRHAFNLNTATNFGRTPIGMVLESYHDNAAIVKLLWDEGADIQQVSQFTDCVDSKSIKRRRTPLDHAHRVSQLSVANMILARFANEKANTYFKNIQYQQNEVMGSVKLDLILSAALMGLNSTVYNDLSHNEVCSSYLDAFIHWMIAQDSSVLSYQQHVNMHATDNKVVLNAWKKVSQRDSLQEGYGVINLNDDVPQGELDAMIICAMYTLNKAYFEFTRRGFKKAFIKLIEDRYVIQKALRDRMILTDRVCLLLNVLQSHKKDHSLQETKSFIEVRDFLKNVPASTVAIQALKEKVSEGKEASPRDATLFLALAGDGIEPDGFARIVNTHLNTSFGLKDEKHVQVVDALKLLSDEHAKKLKLKLCECVKNNAVLIKSIKVIFQDKHPVDEHCLLRIIKAGKRSGEPKSSTKIYDQFKKEIGVIESVVDVVVGFFRSKKDKSVITAAQKEHEKVSERVSPL